MWLLFAASLTSTLGQFILKKGMAQFPQFLGDGINPVQIIKVLFNPVIFVGLAIFGVSSIVWLKILSQSNLSYSYPITVALNFLLISLVSLLILRESINGYQLLGMIGIVASITLFSLNS